MQWIQSVILLAIMEQISLAIKHACKKLFDVDVEPVLTHPDEQFGDYATNIALQLSKQLGKNPREIAENLKADLQNEAITSVEIAGPGFLNFRVSSESLASKLKTEIQTSQLGRTHVGRGKTVVAEYPSPNMAKPFSVGHLRSATQGWAIAQLMQRMGYEVVTDNHIGDHGTPYGKWVVGFLKYSSEAELNTKGIYELARIYIQITTELKAEKEKNEHNLADEVQQWLKKLEAKDEQAVHYSEWFNKISMEHLQKIMDRLKISTKYTIGESAYVARGQQMVDELLQKGIAELSDGAVIVRLDEFGIDTPVMLRKANGAALYATTDLATVEYREQHWSPEKVFIHTGQEQAFYFRQLNALAQKSGYRPVIEHLWHGLIDQKDETGKRQKMSSRQGVVLLEELLDAAENHAREQMKEGSEEDVKAVALGAVKFADFTADRKNGMLFDWETMFSVQGFSGPAVQYAVVRISSILSKAETASPVEGYDWQPEHLLLLKLLDYTPLLKEIHQSYEMHKLATYLYSLAREFNRYYEANRILNADEIALVNRLWFIALVKEVLTDGLDILGIPTPQRM